MASVDFQNINIYNVSGVQQKKAPDKTVSIPAETAPKPAFKADAYTSAVTIRTSLTTKDEKKKYEELSNELDLKYRKKLEFALKSGLLLKNNSNDRSSVLDNLHKIITEERDPGLDKINILQECLDILANPYVITQTCEDIPAQYKRQVIGLMTNLSEIQKRLQRRNGNLKICIREPVLLQVLSLILQQSIQLNFLEW